MQGVDCGRQPGTSTDALVQALAPPVGSVAVTTSPRLVVATQSETEGHDTPSRVPRSNGIDALVQALAPPVGSVDVRMVSAVGPPPPATHMELTAETSDEQQALSPSGGE